MRARVEGQVWIPKTDLGQVGVDFLKKTLTIKPKHAPGYSDEKPEPVLCWTEDDAHPGELGVPRDFFFDTAKKGYEVEWALSEGFPTSYGSVLRQEGPYAEQGQAIAELRHWLEGLDRERARPMEAGRHMGALLKADPGFGKTNTALALAHGLARTTVILVHKERLLMQWKRRAEKFLPGVRIGFVREDECDFEDKDIVIAMMQSLAMERFGAKYPREFYLWPALLLIDEAHRVGANTWSPIPPMFPAKWRVALTATPRRKDGCDKVFWWHVGPIRYDAKTERPKPSVRIVDSGLGSGVPKVLRKEGISPSIVINVLTKLTTRNRTIVDEIVKALSAPSGRKILVLSERLEHLRTLDELLASECKRVDLEGITTGFYVGQWFTGEKTEKLAKGHWSMADGGREKAMETIYMTFRRRRDLKAEKDAEGSRLIFCRPGEDESEQWLDLDAELDGVNGAALHGAVLEDALREFDAMLFWIAKEYEIKQKVEERKAYLTEEQLHEAERARVIWMTYQMCSEGIDIPAADTLGFASPISDAEQAYGRGRRECVPVAHGGDKSPDECEHYCPWRAATCTGKPQPRAFDIVDELVPLARKRQRYREEFYKEVGAVVRGY